MACSNAGHSQAGSFSKSLSPVSTGWDREANAGWSSGGRAALNLGCSLNQNHIFARDNRHPSKAALRSALLMRCLPHPLAHVGHTYQPRNSASGVPEATFIVMQTPEVAMFFPPTTGQGSSRMQDHLDWVLAMDVYLLWMRSRNSGHSPFNSINNHTGQ